MPKPRGRSHTTLTETAQLVVKTINKLPGIKMIAPGEIASTRSNVQRITITHTNAGLSLSISGQGTQRIAVHTDNAVTVKQIVSHLKTAKKLQGFIISERIRKPGI
jgi:hypothetical protein